MQKDLVRQLYVGFSHDGNYIREIELLPTNGIAEKVFTEKLRDKPYTWIARVIAIASKRIGDVPVGDALREESLRTGDFNVPEIVKKITLADATSLMPIIHRSVWENLVPQQNVFCNFCSKSIYVDIDLDEMKLDEKSAAGVSENKEYHNLVVNLKDGFIFDGLKGKGKDGDVMFPDLAGVQFNRITLRIPTLAVAIRNERYIDDTIKFWRLTAFDCLESIEAVSGDTITSELPRNAINMLGMRIFDVLLSGRDLKSIRHALREELPVLPFHYDTECACPEKRQIPVSVDSSGFFST